MRPTTVRFNNTRASASRRRCSAVAAPVAKQAAPQVSLVQRNAISAAAKDPSIKAA
ncbi:hypothetical protein [Vibrio sp. SCSIO 43136]|uniref:hypothetical protein n=1 Tax=Vibrio sp. SCSIO 43136 TaxID=2819101 RepID=UPI0020756662|nr:hypothetical protein [Vibrio sp. SCSIO 43136]USD65321.1 hypothetical protein J4N39_00095 [Vibrio sp. SCSIO 43136]